MYARSSLLTTSQDEQYADDPVMEGYLQLLAADKSKVSSAQLQEQSHLQDTTFALCSFDAPKTPTACMPQQLSSKVLLPEFSCAT